MKTVTYEEFLRFGPCWLRKKDGAERIKAYFDRFNGKMSALDILHLDDVSVDDKLWSVLREEFISAPILHEFGCVCAEYALSLIDDPDSRSIKAVEVKRAWIRGEATDEELVDARNAAIDAACDAASGSVLNAAMATVWVTRNAYRADWDAAWHTSEAAWEVVRDDARYDSDAACNAVCEAQVAYLIMTLEEEVCKQ